MIGATLRFQLFFASWHMPQPHESKDVCLILSEKPKNQPIQEFVGGTLIRFFLEFFVLKVAFWCDFEDKHLSYLSEKPKNQPIQEFVGGTIIRFFLEFVVLKVAFWCDFEDKHLSYFIRKT